MNHLIALLFILAAGQANAQQMCGPRDTLIASLGEKYGESVSGQGTNSNTLIIELWVNPETGTWTFVSTAPNGTSCINAAGQNWQAVVQGQPA